MLAQEQPVIRHFFMDEERKLKQIAASVISRNDKLCMILSNGFKAAEKCLPFGAFHVIFDEQPLSVQLCCVIERIAGDRMQFGATCRFFVR